MSDFQLSNVDKLGQLPNKSTNSLNSKQVHPWFENTPMCDHNGVYNQWVETNNMCSDLPQATSNQM